MKMTMIGLIGLMILAVAGFGAARLFWKNKPETKLVEVVEATKSVLPDAQAESFAATEKSAESLGRGDEIVVIPLTSDAANEAQGKTVRHRFGTTRKAFDKDLRETKQKIRDDLENLRTEVAEKPFKRTDLFGTIRLAAEEKPKRAEDKFIVAILTDFIEDTPEMNFNTNPALANIEAAQKLAAQMVKGRENSFQNAKIFLGQMRSEDLKKLSTARREAIRAFWLEFFRLSGAGEIVWATDGTGGLEEFLRQNGGGGK